ncbi:CU044_5270 family protein [Plantactinospora sp. KLBMP9567]|uniref:CU044_5270 family protein n=1 Tax=Plantactinospora sp. KLBMP9567 TaxID=3085900 RepID=UPI002982625F|nr:CU044_5270 family protein [Plantactinospora sp. KLBMP9567]MDW5325344.1 CU044_5270 family protein [Plantactinospora sp. KLBMP9567]
MSSRSTLSPPGRLGVLALAAGTTLALIASTTVIVQPPEGETSALHRAASTPPPVAPSLPVRPSVSDRLFALAARIDPKSDDSHAGPYTYVHTRQWARNGQALARFEVEQWRHPNGSGVIIERRPPDRSILTGLPAKEELAVFRRARAKREQYGPGRLAPELAEPISADPGTLVIQLHALVPPQSGPGALVTAVANIHRTHYLDHRQRAAVLRVLAPIPSLRYEGEVTDVAGRAGIAVSLNGGPSTTTLVFDRTTGALLAHQESLNTQPPALFQYQLFEHGRRSLPGK